MYVCAKSNPRTDSTLTKINNRMHQKNPFDRDVISENFLKIGYIPAIFEPKILTNIPRGVTRD